LFECDKEKLSIVPFKLNFFRSSILFANAAFRNKMMSYISIKQPFFTTKHEDILGHKSILEFF